MSTVQQALHFAQFTLDLERCALREGGVDHPLRPKSFDVLRYLAERAGRVVSKNELIERAWPGVHVTDDSLVQCIGDIRQVLGADGRTIIKTMPRRGYLFTAKVSHATENTPAVSARDAVASTGSSDSRSAMTRQRTIAPALALPDRPSIAVLPFRNMSGDADEEHFADGMSEDLITGLARIRWLFVIGRNSTFAYKHRPVEMKQLSRELGVRYVLVGSIRRAGNRLRISAQLVDAKTSGRYWAETYDRDLGDKFAVQDDITRSVAATIEPQLLAVEGVRALSLSSDDLDAWDLVARAQTYVWRMTPADNETAIAVLRRAAEAFPDYAPALSLLGYCFVFGAHMGWIDRAQALGPGREHAMRAVTLDERNPWAHIARGYLALMERRTEEMITSFRRALDLNPNSAAAHAQLGHGLAFVPGQHAEAIAHAQVAMRLSPFDPLSVLFAGTCAVANFAAGHYAEAARCAEEALRLRPGFHGAYRTISASLALAGEVKKARSLLVTAREAQPQLSIDWMSANSPFQTPELRERLIEGIRKAGLRD